MRTKGSAKMMLLMLSVLFLSSLPLYVGQYHTCCCWTCVWHYWIVSLFWSSLNSSQVDLKALILPVQSDSPYKLVPTSIWGAMQSTLQKKTEWSIWIGYVQCIVKLQWLLLLKVYENVCHCDQNHLSCSLKASSF